MIVYKNVVKKENKYYSLMNYGFCRLNRKIITNQLPYELNKTYINTEIESNKIRKYFLEKIGRIPDWIVSGFYFNIKKKPLTDLQLECMKELGADKIVILKCEIQPEDILPLLRLDEIRAKKFKVLKEI